MGILRIILFCLIGLVSQAQQLVEQKTYPFPSYSIEFNGTDNGLHLDSIYETDRYVYIDIDFYPISNNSVNCIFMLGEKTGVFWSNFKRVQVFNNLGSNILQSNSNDVVLNTWNNLKFELNKDIPLLKITVNGNDYQTTVFATTGFTTNNCALAFRESTGSLWANVRFKDFKPQAKNINVVAVGDSQTLGNNVDSDETYPYVLNENLREYYNVTNRGVSGQTTAGAIHNYPSGIVGYKLDCKYYNQNKNIAVIMYGINDIKNAGYSAQRVADSLNSLYALFNNDLWYVIGCTVPYVTTPQNLSLNESIDSLNTILKASADVDYLFDLNAIIDINSHILADGIHINATGLSLWADSIESIVLNTVNYDSIVYASYIPFMGAYGSKVWDVDNGTEYTTETTPKWVKNDGVDYGENHGVSKHYYKGHSVYVPYLLSGLPISVQAINAAETVINYPATLWGENYWVK